MSNKTPLEETFNLPSIDDINKTFSQEAIENAEDDDSDDMKDYLKDQVRRPKIYDLDHLLVFKYKKVVRWSDDRSR